MPSAESGPVFDVGKAHQRVVREKYDDEPPPPVPHLSVKRARVRPVSYATARQIILRYEWLGTMAKTARHFGIFFGPYCAGVTCLGKVGASPSFHMQFGLEEGEVWTLARGACVHWAPENTNSKLVAWSLRLLRECEPRARLVAAFSDREAGEVGTIYQAAGWTFVGAGSPTPEIVSPTGRRVLNVRNVTDWARRARVSFSEQMDALKEQGWTYRERNPKMKYVAVLDRSDRELVERIEAMALPYPKRSD